MSRPSAIHTVQIMEPVEVTAQGLVGDRKVDPAHHHPDQAVSIYLTDDYMFWRMQLRKPLTPGTFGENLTIDDLRAPDLAVGDRFVIGEVVLEVTAQRQSCKSFELRMEDADWTRRFRAAGRPGAYCRVLSPGTVRRRDEVEYLPFVGPTIRLAELSAVETVAVMRESLIARALAAPLHEHLRARFEGIRGFSEMVAGGLPMGMG
jgi:MOSC domain-containing protein YiiM